MEHLTISNLQFMKMKFKIFLPFLITITSITAIRLIAQDDLEKLLDSQAGDEINYVYATFKNTHVLNGHSIETLKHRNLEFRISHRFGELSQGVYNFWGLDQANIHFSLDYGIYDWFNIGVGRGTYEKTFDGFVKFKIFRQTTGARQMPVSIAYLISIAVNSINEKALNDYFTNRLSFCHELMIARKLNDILSLQISPVIVHRNFVETAIDLNDLFALGLGGRIKLSKRISFNAEYFYVAKPSSVDYAFYNPLSMGFDIETGGHVFQLHLTNSLAMIEKGFIGETTGKWKNKGIHIGFNITRTFAL